MTRQTWILVGLFGLGFGFGLCVGDFAIHWMGWEGPTTVSMVGAFVTWISLFPQMRSRGQFRSGSNGSRLNPRG